MAPDETDVNRRTFMKRVSATGAVGFGIASGTAPAAAKTQAVSPAQVDALLKTHADELVSELIADGYLADRSDLQATALDLGDIAAGSEGATKVSVPTGPSEYRIQTQIEQGTLSLVVRPTSGSALALLDTGSRTLAYDADVGWSDFDALSSCRCTDMECPDLPAYIEECCFGSSCTYECGCF